VNKYVQLFRLGNCLMGVLGMLMGAFIAAGAGMADHPLGLTAASAAVLLCIIGGNSLNDYLDREVDKAAHPERPIPSGRMAPATAKRISIGAFALAALASLVLDWLSIVIVLTSMAIMIAYELRTKKLGLIGNGSIGWLTGALFLFGGAVVGMPDRVWAIAAMAALASLAREIVKDVQDVESDFDRRTLPMSIGVRNASVVASLTFIAAVALSPQPYLAGYFGLPYVAAVAVADAIFIYCSGVVFRSPERAQKLAKLGMLVALVAFLLGGIS